MRAPPSGQSVISPRGIQIALDLARMPSLYRSSAAMTPPSDITDVIRIAAADNEACLAAAAVTGENGSTLIEAARLFVKQVLFRPEADCFRVLGISPGSPKSLGRDHMRMLLAWLHPDHNRDGDSVFAHRVLQAWSEFSRRTEGHALDDASPGVARKRTRRRTRSRLPLIRIDNPRPPERRKQFWLILLLGAIGVCVAAATAFPDKIYAIAQAVPFNE